MGKRREKQNNTGKKILTGFLCVLLAAIVVAIVYLGNQIRLADREEDGPKNTSSVSQEMQDSSSASSTEEENQGSVSASSEQPTPEVTDTPTPTSTPQVQSVSGANMHSTHAILVRAADGAVMMDKAASEKVYPASITKMMTAILAIEKLSDLDEQITIPEEIFPELTEAGASVAGFYPYEKVSVRSLLYGIMLPSGADACLTVAGKIAGSEEGFAELMNQKAAELGMSGTHFVNSTGLHDDQHYTTCADLAVLMRYCLQNEVFRTIISASEYRTEATGSHPDGIRMNSTMKIKFSDAQISTTMTNGLVVEGGKTGFTDTAGQCLASFGSLNGKEYILITTGAPASYASEIMSVQDAETIYSRITAES